MQLFYKRILVFFAISSLLALSTYVHAAETVDTGDVNTPQKDIRGNEGVASKTDDQVIQREEERINPNGFSVAELKMMKANAEKHSFQAQVNKLMNIIVNSLYSNREVFLRELISNASDALDKIRFLSLTDPNQLSSGAALEIRIKADKAAKTLTITDTGIGMTKQNLIDNLGTIAKSGTSEFLEKMKNATSDNSLIGQFGVGFYSAFLVADSVTVVSKNNDDEKQHFWESDTSGEFSVGEDPRGNTLNRGTSIILHLSEHALEFADEDVLRNLVRKYSMFINFPIYLWTSEDVEKEVAMTDDEIAEARAKKLKELEEQKENKEDEETVNLDEEATPAESDVDVPTTKKVTETVSKWEIMNETKPLWTRNAKEISDEEYNQFYKTITKDENDPLMKIHFLGEGDVEFKSLLYVPRSTSNLYNDHLHTNGTGIKLYVKRVFISDSFVDILPRYLAFIRGIVDSDDLPLNVSREMLQESRIIQMIRKKLVRKAIAMFQILSEDKEKYEEFYKRYGINLKMGLIDDAANKTRLAKLLMFFSSKTGELATFQQYVDRMKEGQTSIYYLAGQSREVVENSPLLEKLLKEGYEVLYMLDPVDEYALGNLDKFDGKYKLVNVAKDDLQLPESKNSSDAENTEKADAAKARQEEFADLLKFLKNSLNSRVDRVTLSSRLTKSPVALISAAGFTANMERIMKAQALHDPNSPHYVTPRKAMEINPDHVLIQELNRKVLAGNTKEAADIADLLFDTAALVSGFVMDQPSAFAARVERMMAANMGVELPEPEPVKSTSTGTENGSGSAKEADMPQHDEL